MTLRWVEGFEALGSQTAITNYYENVTWSSPTFVAGSVHGTALQSGSAGTSTIFRTPDLGITASEWIIGMRVNVDEVTINTTKTLMSLYNGTTLLGSLQWRTQSPNTGIRFRWIRNNGASVVEGAVLANDVTRYLQIRVLMSNTSSGEVEILVDGAAYASITAATTAVVATTLNKVQFELGHSGNASSKVVIDDIYILDTSGGVQDNFLGNQSVEAIYADGDGAATDWTPLGAGSHYVEVDELTVDDGDTSYVAASNDNDQDLFTFGDLTVLAGAVNGVMVKARMKNDSAGSRNVEMLHRSVAGNISNGTTKVVNSTSYSSFTQIWEQNPDGPADWTVNEINGSQFGMELVP